VGLCLQALDEIEIRVCESQAVAFRELARLCREDWTLARRVDERTPNDGERSKLSPAPPDDDRTAVDCYFAVMREVFRSYSITSHDLVSGDAEGTTR
jgi:hypothetical protein